MKTIHNLKILLMSKETESKENIPYREWTPEMKAEADREEDLLWEKAAKEASEAMKESARTGIWPDSEMKNYTLKK
jgi:hypothetical protein